MSDLKVDYYKLLRYVDAVCNLAESVAGDIKGSKKGMISNETVVNLAKFYRAEQGVQSLLESVELDRKQVN